MALDWNPVLLKEFRPWLRQERDGWRLFTLSLLMLLAMGACLSLKAFAAGVFTRVGQVAFLVFGMLQWSVSAQAVMPAASAIAAEREKHTLEGLTSSPLHPEVLVRGKVLFAAYMATLSQFTIAPFLAGTWLLGGVRAELIPIYLVLLVLHNLFLASAGVYFSTLPHKVPRASIGMLQTTFQRSQIAQQKAMGLWVLFVMPTIYGTITVMGTATAGAAAGLPAPLVAAWGLIDRIKVLAAVFPVLTLTADEPVSWFGITLPFWGAALILQTLLAFLFYRLAISAVQGRAHDRGPGVRVWAALLTLGVLLLALGNLWPATPADAEAAVYVFVCLAAGWFLLLLLPALVSGDALPEDREERWSGLWRTLRSPARMFRHRTGTAIPYLAACALPFAFLTGWLAAAAPNAAPVRLVLEAGALSLAVLVGYGVFALSFSVRRRAGVSAPGLYGLASLLLFLGLVLPTLAQSLAGAGVLPPVAAIPLSVTAALLGACNPVQGWVDAVDRSVGGTCWLSNHLQSVTGALPVPVWTIAAGVALLLGAIGILRLRGDWQEPLPVPGEELEMAG